MRTQPLPEYTHIAFTVTANFFEQMKQILISKGVVVWKENSSEGESFYFLDPDQHKLENHVGDWQTRLNRYESDLEMKKCLYAYGEQGNSSQTQNIETKKIVEEKDLTK